MKNTKEKNPSVYLERDISWMHFNARVLQEAADPSVPLLERLGFLGIYSNNLDEFFRVRMASDSRMAQMKDRDMQQQATHARELVKKLQAIDATLVERYSTTINDVSSLLRTQGIEFIDETQLTDTQKHFVKSWFRQTVAGFVNPQWLKSAKDLYNYRDANIYLALCLENKDRDPEYAIIELPVARVGRYLLLPHLGDKTQIIYLDDVIRFCLPCLFPGMHFDSYKAYSFKFTRDAEMEIDDDLHAGLLQKVAKAVKNRRKGPAMRVIYDATMPEALLQKLLRHLKVDDLDTLQPSGRYHNHKDLMSLPSLDRPDLKYPPMPPLVPKQLKQTDSLLLDIQQHDRLLHVPYQTFDYFIRLLQEAAVSPSVKNIKMSLYRVAEHSKVVQALIGAARNGKKVTVLVELMARFDEQTNINVARSMQDAGIKVIFGPEGMKVHSKILYIGLRKSRDIAVISTGNFHEGNARHYTDCLYFTSRHQITAEANSVFDLIQKPFSDISFKHLMVSPASMRNQIYRLIDNEIKNARAGHKAWIKVKINHITDPDIVQKLYEASQAGVKIDMLVRGCCSLIPKVKGVSENINAYGIIDRFLEHSRILIFHAGGKNLTYIGSADWMPRNLNHRIETMVPVQDESLKKELRFIIDAGLKDNVKGRIVDGTGANLYHSIPGQLPYRSQEELYAYYKNKQL